MKVAAFIGRSGIDISTMFEITTAAADALDEILLITNNESSRRAPIVYAVYNGGEAQDTAIDTADYLGFPGGSVLVDGYGGKIYVKKTDNTWAAQS